MSSVLMIWQIRNSSTVLFILRNILLLNWKQITKGERKTTLLAGRTGTLKPFMLCLIVEHEFDFWLLSNQVAPTTKTTTFFCNTSQYWAALGLFLKGHIFYKICPKVFFSPSIQAHYFLSYPVFRAISPFCIFQSNWSLYSVCTTFKFNSHMLYFIIANINKNTEDIYLESHLIYPSSLTSNKICLCRDWTASKANR